MERRYLAATIAMAATFAMFSHAFNSGLMSKLQAQHTTLISELHCAAQSLRSQLLDKLHRSLGPGSAEEAQLRVDLNIPTPAAPALPALPKVIVALPAPAVPPMRMAARPVAPATPNVYCPSKAIATDVNFSDDVDQKVQAQMMAAQAKVMAVQARLASRAMQREITQAALAQARANILQVRLKTLQECRPLHDHAMKNRDQASSSYEMQQYGIDMDQLSNEITDQVSRSLENSLRNF